MLKRSCKAPNIFFKFATDPAKVRSSTRMSQATLEKTKALPESVHRLMHLPNHPITAAPRHLARKSDVNLLFHGLAQCA